MKEGLEAFAAIDESLLVKSAIVLMLEVIDEQNQSEESLALNRV